MKELAIDEGRMTSKSRQSRAPGAAIGNLCAAGGSPFALRHSPFVNGFTLIELLTAMAVLGIIMMMLMQVVSGILQSTRMQTQQMGSVENARRALDAMDADLKKAVVGEMASVLVSSSAPKIAFLSQRRGPANAAGHRFLAVTYETNADHELVRGYASVGYTDTDLLAASINTNTNSVVADGILGFKIMVVTSSTNFPSTGAPSPNWATNNYNGTATPTNFNALVTSAPAFAAGLTNRARALRVWVAAVDDQNYSLLTNTSMLNNALAAIAGKTNPAEWRAAIDDASIPPQTKSGIRILTKTIPLR